MPTKFHLLLACFLLTAFRLAAQELPLQNGSFQACEGELTDPGGSNSPYDANASVIMSILPETIGSGGLQLRFHSLQLGMGDTLCIYDGLDTSATLLQCLDLSLNNSAILLQSTAANPSGGLTLYFRSDGSDQQDGWRASLACIGSCQSVVAVLDSTRPAALPDQSGYIDICPGERVFFYGSGDYPQNGIVYQQSDENSRFRWDFGDGSFGLGQSASHIYTTPGGYTAQLTVTDANGCQNTNYLNIRVRVAPPPLFDVRDDFEDGFCNTDTLVLTGSISGLGAASIVAYPGGGSFKPNAPAPDPVALEDNTGVSYTSELLLSGYAAGQTLRSAKDIDAICATLEHSWARDLQLRLECPNGQSVILQEALPLKGDQTILGRPLTNDAAAVMPGSGATYCWDTNEGRETWLDFIDRSAPDTLPPGTYAPSEPLSQLEGCPLNGSWTLSIEDQFLQDNGYLFDWNISFNESIQSEQDPFAPALTGQSWQPNPFIIENSGPQITIAPDVAGTLFFRYQVEDSFGCRHDTAVSIPVFPFSDEECLECEQLYPEIPDTAICQGESLPLQLFDPAIQDSVFTFTTNPQYPIGFSNHPPENAYRSPITISGVPGDTLTDPESQIRSVCLNLETDWVEDIALFLEAPGGQILELSTNNGGGFDNYRNTCFVTRPAVSITEGAAPFNGNFQPEGDWGDLTGTPINGTWTLLASDSFDLQEIGQLTDWSIQFYTENQPQISWTPTTTVSCTDCPNPVLSPEETTTYQLQITDEYGCSRQQEFTVEVIPNYPAPLVNCYSSSDSEMTFEWTRLDDNVPYDISYTINGNTPIVLSAIADTFFIVNNLTAGDLVQLEVSAASNQGSPDCSPASGSSSCIFGQCNTLLELVEQTDLSCFGDANGSIEVRANGGPLPFRYQLNGSGTIQEGNGRFTNLPAGIGYVSVQDKGVCTDTLFFEILQPDSLQAGLSIQQEINCADSTNGQLLSMPDGGAAPYSIQWSTGSTDTLISGLAAGTYQVTITDANGCSLQDSILLSAPLPMLLELSIDSINCPDSQDGRLQAQLNGGTAPYQYQWSTGSTDTLISNLSAGDYALTVTDTNGCQQQTQTSLSVPDSIQIDSVRIRAASCFGRQDGQITVFASGGTGMLTYEWQDALAQRGPQATNLQGGSLDLLIIDENNCTLTGNYNIPQPDSIRIAVDPTHVICKGEADGSITLDVSGGTTPYQYEWEDGQTTETATGLAVGIHRFTVTDNNGCRKTGQNRLVEPEEVLNVAVDQSLQGCFGTAGNAAIASASGGTGGVGYTYRWSDGQSGTEATGLDSLEYTVSISDLGGCTKAISIKLQDLPDMNPNMIINQPSCFGFSNGAIGINFIEGRPAADLRQYTFEWNTGQTGSSIQGLLGDSTYTVTVTDPLGCTAEESRLVKQPQLITFDLAVRDASCYEGADGSIQITNIQADSDDLVYQWDNRAGSATTPEVDGLSAGTYFVTVTDQFSCNNTGTAVVRQPEPISIAFESEENTCFGDQSGAIMALASGGTPGYTFSWSNGGITNQQTQLFAGSYAVTVTDENGCTETATGTVTQPDAYEVNIQTEDISCHGDEDGAIVVQISGGAPPYQFSLDNREYIGSPILIGLAEGTYDIYVRDANNCLYLDRTDVKGPGPFRVFADPPSTTIALGDSVQLLAIADNPQGFVDFSWQEPYPGTLSCLDCDSLVARPENTITYKLTGIDSVGCEASDIVRIFVQKNRTIAVPTGFSPNDDGNNDRLIVHGLNNTTVTLFQVFDRWGEQIYEGRDFPVNDATQGWDGTFRGEPMGTGVYVWFLEVEFPDGRRDSFRGQTTLIR